MRDSSTSGILQDYNRSFFHKLCADILRQGPIPKHVAVIMDGNRRYAKKKNMTSATEGHRKGEEKLLQVAKILLDLKIKEVTIFAFSEDNFKRSTAEVKGLMDLAIERMQKILRKSNELEELGICCDVVGDWEQIPSLELKTLFAKACQVTRNNERLTLHIAFSYSSHREISEGVKSLTEGLLKESIAVGDLNERLFQDAFTLHSTNPVDFLIRTGGDERLSDFVLWQVSHAHLEFIGCTWPELREWDLLKALWNFQSQVVFEGLKKQEYNEDGCSTPGNLEDQKAFIYNSRQMKWNWIENLI